MEDLNSIIVKINLLSKQSEMPQCAKLCRQALTLVNKKENPVLWAALTAELGNSLSQIPIGDRAENIEEAIRCYRQAMEIKNRDTMPVGWARTMLNLGAAYSERIRGDRGNNIEKAVHCYEQALAVMNKDVMPVEWAAIRMNLGIAYYSRIRGDLAENIEEAVRCYKQALEVITREAMPFEWGKIKTNMANAYLDRIRGDRFENIEKAIRCSMQALEILRRDSMPVEWAEATVNLAKAYSERGRGDVAENIEEAIRCYKQAMEVMTRDAMPIEWTEAMMNLATAYIERIYGDPAENVEEAIRCQERTLEVRTRETMSLGWARTMNNLSNSYFERSRGERGENIEKAIHGYKQALQVITRDIMPVEWAQAMSNLAESYASRIQGDRFANIEEAIRCYRRALEVMTRETMPLYHRKTQQKLGNLCARERRWTQAQEAFGGVLAANEILYESAPLPESRQSELLEVRGSAARMAYTLVKSAASENMPDAMIKSVEALEKNRARWLSEALSMKSGKPENVPDKVWNEFETRRKDYNQLLAESRLPENTPGRRTFLELSAAMRNASEMLDAALVKVREHESSFMPDPDFEQIRSAVSSPGEVLVYFAVTPMGSVVFVVRAECEPVEHIWLDNLLEETLDETIQNYLDTYVKWRANPNNATARSAWFDILDSTMNRLWDWLMGPLTGRLAESGINRAIMIPQGLLGLLPLHAAWTSANGKRRYALDDVCYTYAPNALSIIASRDLAKHTSPERLLAIEEPFPVNAPSLPNANVEVAAICRHFPETKKVLADEMATKNAVYYALPKNRVFHFSCHGIADFNEPLDSGMLMANDETLTLRDFLSIELKGARLAVLSACETGIPDIENADEVIGLPAGLVQAGVAGVAASLWSVSDLSTMMLMFRFYEFWRKDNLEPAEALRQAQIWLRDTANIQRTSYFSGFLPEFHKSEFEQTDPRLPTYVADMIYKASLSARPDQNDFEHPFYWAGFTLTGI